MCFDIGWQHQLIIPVFADIHHAVIGDIKVIIFLNGYVCLYNRNVIEMHPFGQIGVISMGCEHLIARVASSDARHTRPDESACGTKVKVLHP
jgi:hypothetical protein